MEQLLIQIFVLPKFSEILGPPPLFQNPAYATGQQSFAVIQARTLEEAKLQNEDEFQISIDELHAFVGFCIVRGVIKGRDEPLHSFWNTDYGRQIFTETMSRNKFMKILEIHSI